MSLKQSAISGIKWTSLSTAAIAVLQIVQLAVLARLLKPTDFGLMAMTMVVIGFAQSYTDTGISAAIVHRQNISREQLSSLYWLNIYVSLAVFVLVSAASPLIVWFFHEPLLSKLIPIAAISLLISSAGLQFQWLLEKELKFDLLARQEIFSTVGGTIVAVSAAFLGQGVWSLVWGQIMNAGIKTVLRVKAGWAQWPPLLYFRRDDLRGFLSFGFYQMGERSINYFNSRFDQLLIGNLLGAQELGYYNFAFNLVMQPINYINPTMTRVAFPVFARLQNDLNGLRQSYLKMVNILSTINAPLLFGLSAVAPLLLPLIFGNKWNPAVLLVQILAFYAFVRSVCNPIGSLLLGKGRADLGFRWNLALLFTTAPVVYAGARLGGATGIAVALAVLIICYLLVSYTFLVKTLIGPCANAYSASILKPALLAAIMGSGVWLMIAGGWHSITWLTTAIMIGALSYLALLRFFDHAFLLEVRDIVMKAGP